MSQPNDPRIGTELAGFRIESLIGRGGMGVVYLAEQVRYGRKVALKILAPELAADSGFRDRFEQEWRMAAKLEHPNIVPVYEAGEAEGVLYIAMRYVGGIDLNALLAREGRLEAPRALGIVSQVASALDAAHAQGLVHRDVKPGNILVAQVQGAPEHVYLTDFGVAKQTTAGSGLTKTGLFIGTVDYAAPEQIEGKTLDGRADVYALGCVLYQCLTGVLPYEKDSEVAMLYAHLMETPPSLAAKDPELEPLDPVIAKALAKSPDDRYPTCRELVSSAQTALASAAPTAVETAAGAALTVADPNRTVAGRPAAGPTVADGPRGAVPATVKATTADGAPPPWWRSRRALIAGAAVLVLAGAGAGIAAALSGGGGGGSTTSAVTTGTATGVTTAAAGDGGTSAGSTGTDVSSGSGAIVFESWRSGALDLYAMHLDGSGRARLTNTPAEELTPKYSPDGTKIAYASNEGGDFEIVVSNADGSDPKALTDNAVDDGNPAWSPDGTKIAYAEQRGADLEIFLMNSDGSDPQQLTDNSVDDELPDWSPDGSEIAFSSTSGPNGAFEVRVMNADGSGQKSLTATKAASEAPAWSPDGSTILFTSNREGGNFDIWQMNADGSDQRRLASAAEEDSLPRWVPNGAQIVYQSSRDGDFEIFIMNADGSSQTQLTDDLTPDYAPDASLKAVVPPASASDKFLTDPTAFPNEREAVLLMSVPPQTRASCTTDKDKPRLSLAGVSCTSGQVAVYYAQFRTKAAMDALFKRFQDGNPTTPNTSCDSNQTVVTTWHITGATTQTGRLLCYDATSGQAVIVWTYDDLLILSQAVRSDDNRRALYRWWKTGDSGPIAQ